MTTAQATRTHAVKKWTPERIKKLRRSLEETQEEFARRFRLSTIAVRIWEAGKGHPSGPATVLLDQLESERQPVAVA